MVTLSGKDIYLGVYETEESRAEYRRVIAEWLQSNQITPATSRAGKVTDSELIDINELLVAYWPFAEQYYIIDGQPSRELVHIRHAAKPLAELYGSIPIEECRPTSLKVLRQQMIDSGLSRGTIKRRINRIRRVFKWSVENDHLEPSIYQALKAIPITVQSDPAKASGGTRSR